MASKFYSILLSEEMHNSLKKMSYETGEHISNLVRKGIQAVLTGNDSFVDGKCECKK
ncbi:MAG: ribbon-helix-helix domain-containing protein [Planctomycetia bacterium]|nr:ribbon-helix-helix domain-containing protein [Planctomycetia bacterium]